MNYGYVCMVHASSFCCVVSRSFFRCLLFLTSSIGGNGVEAESSSSKVSLALNFGSVTLCKCVEGVEADGFENIDGS